MFELGKIAAQKRIFEELNAGNAARILGWALSCNAGHFHFSDEELILRLTQSLKL